MNLGSWDKCDCQSRPDSRGHRRDLPAVHVSLCRERGTLMRSAWITDMLGVNAGLVGGRKIQTEAPTSLQLETERCTVVGGAWLFTKPSSSARLAFSGLGLIYNQIIASMLGSQWATPGSSPCQPHLGRDANLCCWEVPSTPGWASVGSLLQSALSCLSRCYSSPAFSNTGFLGRFYQLVL